MTTQTEEFPTTGEKRLSDEVDAKYEAWLRRRGFADELKSIESMREFGKRKGGDWRKRKARK